MSDNTKTERCHGCGKIRPLSEMHQFPITQIRQRRVVTELYWFCKGTSCAGHYQMACEG